MSRGHVAVHVVCPGEVSYDGVTAGTDCTRRLPSLTRRPHDDVVHRGAVVVIVIIAG